jgi:hypothetical protein
MFKLILRFFLQREKKHLNRAYCINFKNPKKFSNPKNPKNFITLCYAKPLKVHSLVHVCEVIQKEHLNSTPHCVIVSQRREYLSSFLKQIYIYPLYITKYLVNSNNKFLLKINLILKEKK